jgi:hypothetical protein
MDATIKTKKIMRNAILNYAEKNEEKTIDTQIEIFTDGQDSEPRFNVLTRFDFENVQEITLKKLMVGKWKFDMMGNGLIGETIVKPTIKNILKRLSVQYNKQIHKISVVIATSDLDCADLKLMMCIDKKPFKRLKFSDILD